MLCTFIFEEHLSACHVCMTTCVMRGVGYGRGGIWEGWDMRGVGYGRVGI